MRLCKLMKKNCLLISAFVGIILLVFTILKYAVHNRDSRNIFKTFQTNEFEHGEPINVVLFMTSPEDTKQLPVQLKSILYYRSSPVIFHLFLSNDLLERIVNTLLSSWQAEQVFYKVYRSSSEKTNYFELVNYLKQNLPSSLREAVYISQNIFFISDIGLWMELCSDVSMQSVALWDGEVCSNDSHNCNDKPSIIYFNLQMLKSESRLDRSSITSLPCHLTPYRLNNKQCSDINKNNDNNLAIENIFVVDRKDFHVGNHNDDPLHLSIHESMVSVDSSPPRVRPHRPQVSCQGNYANSFNSKPLTGEYETMSGSGRYGDPNGSSSSSASSSSSSSSSSVKRHKCQKFVDIAHLKMRTQLFYHCGSRWMSGMIDVLTKSTITKSVEDVDVTLTTTLTLDRFTALETMLDQWKGPAAVLLYVNDIDASSKLNRMIGDSKVLKRKDVQDRVAIHLVHQRLPYNPLNYLRNVLITNTYTTHLLYVDVDLLPNSDLHRSISTYLKKSVDDEQANNKLFIVPAFQSFISFEKNFPKNKSELMKFLQEETVTGYKQKKGWALGHRPTNYSHWLEAEEPYHATFKDAFEPYVIVPRDLGARFNEDLLERMGDKIAYTRLLHGMGYDYYVLPRDYVIHLPHPVSHGTLNYFTEENMFECGSHLFEEYRRKLHEMFPQRKF